MPKDDIDYSNTIIYKIYCIDKTITDFYVGHTTNFTKRKYLHKSCCNNLDNKLKIYNIIRQNGGWDNWNMIEISKYNCKDKTEALIKEQYHYDEVNTNLNTLTPYVDKNIFLCDTCNLQCNNSKSYETHINCSLHKKNVIEHYRTKKTPKNSEYLYCEICNFKCCKNSEWDRHISTHKHQHRTNLDMFNAKNADKFVCSYCNKNYKARNSLWYHEKKCSKNISHTTNNDNFIFDKEFVMLILKQNQEVIKQNSELQTNMKAQQNIMMEFIKNGTHNTNNNHSHNKTFNLQFFLNETCKDAMNIMDFVDSIKLQLSDLEKVGSIGYVEGISSIITTNLKALDVTQRPIHCTDNKREILYVKDEDKWEKESDKKGKIRKAIKYIAHKNSKLLPEFKNKYPDCVKSDSIKSDQYNKLIIEAMGGPGDNDLEKEDKIIKNIAKEVIIDK